jgi:hypothetical protein
MEQYHEQLSVHCRNPVRYRLSVRARTLNGAGDKRRHPGNWSIARWVGSVCRQCRWLACCCIGNRVYAQRKHALNVSRPHCKAFTTTTMTRSHANRQTVTVGYTLSGSPIKLLKHHSKKPLLEEIFGLGSRKHYRCLPRRPGKGKAKVIPINTVLRGGTRHPLPPPRAIRESSPDPATDSDPTRRQMPPNSIGDNDDILGFHEDTWKPSKPTKSTRRKKRQTTWPKWRTDILPRVSTAFLIAEQRIFLREELPLLNTVEGSISGKCPTHQCDCNLRAAMVQCVECTGVFQFSSLSLSYAHIIIYSYS